MSEDGLNAEQAKHKLARLKRLAEALEDEAHGRESEGLQKVAEILRDEVTELEARVAPHLIGPDAAAMPTLQ